uniref:Uncharacterized protein n=1 Tax=Parascaris equorum TaxID=6256 RepID=A0A914RJM3_PAREQ
MPNESERIDASFCDGAEGVMTAATESRLRWMYRDEFVAECGRNCLEHVFNRIDDRRAVGGPRLEIIARYRKTSQVHP